MHTINYTYVTEEQTCQAIPVSRSSSVCCHPRPLWAECRSGVLRMRTSKNKSKHIEHSITVLGYSSLRCSFFVTAAARERALTNQRFEWKIT